MRVRPSLLRSVLIVASLTLTACAATESTDSTLSTKAPKPEHAMRWDHHPNSDDWTEEAVAALRSHGSALPTMVPRDIETWCPGYATASQADREAFWIGLISALAKHESTWNPSAVGGGGRWFGLVQISPQTRPAGEGNRGDHREECHPHTQHAAPPELADNLIVREGQRAESDRRRQ